MSPETTRASPLCAGRKNSTELSPALQGRTPATCCVYPSALPPGVFTVTVDPALPFRRLSTANCVYVTMMVCCAFQTDQLLTACATTTSLEISVRRSTDIGNTVVAFIELKEATTESRTIMRIMAVPPGHRQMP